MPVPGFMSLAVYSPLEIFSPDAMKASFIQSLMSLIMSPDSFPQPGHLIHTPLFLPPPPPLCTDSRNTFPLLSSLFSLPLQLSVSTLIVETQGFYLIQEASLFAGG